jgi:hypothetical protein
LPELGVIDLKDALSFHPNMLPLKEKQMIVRTNREKRVNVNIMYGVNLPLFTRVSPPPPLI